MDVLYFDHNGSGPLCMEAADAMRPWLETCAGSTAASHAIGKRAKAASEESRKSLARLINCSPEELIFTSGGTEANNLAIKGFADTLNGGHIILSAVEHACVAQSCAWLEKRGFSTTIVPVDRNCVVQPDRVREAIRSDTKLVCVMHSNNEVGTIQPIKAIAEIARKAGAVFLTDAVQSVGKENIDVTALGADLLSLSAHKFNGPQGIGALYIRKGLRIAPLFHGAGHETGLRSGTQDVLAMVGLGAAAKRSFEHGTAAIEEYKTLRDGFESLLLCNVEGVSINARNVLRLPNTSNFTISGVPAIELLARLPQIAASTGATCHTGSTVPSKVLTALGKTPEECASTLRFSFGYGTKMHDIENAVEMLRAQVTALRA